RIVFSSRDFFLGQIVRDPLTLTSTVQPVPRGRLAPALRRISPNATPHGTEPSQRSRRKLWWVVRVPPCGRFRNAILRPSKTCGISGVFRNHSQALDSACKIGGCVENSGKSRGFQQPRRCLQGELTRSKSLVRI